MGTNLSLASGTAYLGGQQVPTLPGNAIAGDWGLAPMATVASLSWPANLGGANTSGISPTVNTTSSSSASTANPELAKNVSIVTVLVFVVGAFLLYKYIKA